MKVFFAKIVSQKDLSQMFERVLNTPQMSHCRSSPPKVFLGKAVLKIYSKFTGVVEATLLKSHFGMGVLL